VPDHYDDITVLSVRFEGVGENMQDSILEIVIKNDLAEIERVISQFDEFAEQHDLPVKVRQRTNIALDDLLNNIVSYAYDNKDEHEIEVLVALNDQCLVVTIMDKGRPFNPFAQDEPDTKKSLEEREIGGLGIHLVRNLMDEVSYERHINRNIVKLVKKLKESNEREG
jgi:sigma-B regulation protein RsbU (phosphoserine phosphatase)